VKRGKLQGKAAIALIVGGDLLLLLFGWFFLISPQRSTAASIVRATAVAEAQIVELKKPIKIVKPAAVQQPVIRTADLYSLAQAMPSTVDMPDLLLELDQVARSAGVTLTSVTPGAATPSATDPFSTIQITLAFTGDFYALTDMLYRLRSLVTVHSGTLQTSGRLYSVGSVGLTPNGSGSQLNATVIVNAYVYGTTTPVVAGVPAPAVTSTDTTTTDTTSTSTPTSTPTPTSTSTASSADDVAPGP
jgi:Tfp pilus assembly protein PilO